MVQVGVAPEHSALLLLLLLLSEVAPSSLWAAVKGRQLGCGCRLRLRRRRGRRNVLLLVNHLWLLQLLVVNLHLLLLHRTGVDEDPPCVLDVHGINEAEARINLRNLKQDVNLFR